MVCTRRAPAGPDVNAKGTASCWGGPLPGARSLWYCPLHPHKCAHTDTHQPSHSGPPCRAVCRLATQKRPPRATACGAQSGSSAQDVPTCAWRSFACCGLARDHHVTSPRFTFPSWVSDRCWESLPLPRARLGSTNRGEGLSAIHRLVSSAPSPQAASPSLQALPLSPARRPVPPWFPRLCPVQQLCSRPAHPCCPICPQHRGCFPQGLSLSPRPTANPQCFGEVC